MAIKSKSALKREKLKIDLTGSEGNAYVLMGYARKLAEQHGKDFVDILERMQSGDYENLLNVFDEEFGGYVDLYR